MNIILYSTDCPRCKVLETKLNAKGINYEVNKNIDEMEKLGIVMAPALKVNDKIMEFADANRWISAYCSSCVIGGGENRN